MLCKNPYVGRGTVPFGCGQCLPCRINRRRQWMWRQYFESLMHDENCFVTLTYSDEWLPAGGNLEPNVVSLWVKRFRKQIAPRKIRYFMVGEYGGNTIRPHYHLSLFGVSRDTVLEGVHPFRRMDVLIAETWGKGFVSVDEFNENTAQYVAGYVVKKIGDLTDERLYGKVPEFARMSRRPGIGRSAMVIVAKTLTENGFGKALLEDTGDVPKVLKIGQRTIPLGRYMLGALRREVGFTDEQIALIKERGTYVKSVEMSLLLEAALDDSKSASAKSVHLEEMMQRIRQVETRSKLFKRKRGVL